MAKPITRPLPCANPHRNCHVGKGRYSPLKCHALMGLSRADPIYHAKMIVYVGSSIGCVHFRSGRIASCDCPNCCWTLAFGFVFWWYDHIPDIYTVQGCIFKSTRSTVSAKARLGGIDPVFFCPCRNLLWFIWCILSFGVSYFFTSVLKLVILSFRRRIYYIVSHDRPKILDIFGSIYHLLAYRPVYLIFIRPGSL